MKEHLKNLAIKEGRQVVRSFVTTRTDKRTLYLSQLVDGTFSFYALTADMQTSELLRRNLIPMKILLDTNFIFGLLQMHVNAFVSVSTDLISLIKDNKFPFQLYYHPLTIREFNLVLEHTMGRLHGKDWSQAVSRALLKAAFLSGIEYRFHELNAETKITPKEFFDRYSNVERILQSFGIRIYNDEYEPLVADDQTLELISRYKLFLAPKEKPHGTLVHDVVLWRTLQKIRKKSSEPFGTGAMFLSCDYSFFNFDRKKLRQAGQTGTVILPNVFLQLLRPFVPRTQDFDAKFIETFALPEFRTIHGADNKALSRIAQTLTLYSDIDESLALKLLTDEALISKVRDLKEDDPAIQPLIEEAIVAENHALRQDLQAAATSLAANESALLHVSDRLNEMRAAATLQHEAASAIVSATTSELSAKQAEIDRIRAEAERDKSARADLERALKQLESETAARKAKKAQLWRKLRTLCRFTLYLLPLPGILLAVRFGLIRQPAHPRLAWTFLLLGSVATCLFDFFLREHKRKRGLMLTEWLVIAVAVLAAFGFDWQNVPLILLITILSVVAQIIDK